MERQTKIGVIEVKSFIWNLNLENIQELKSSPNFNTDGHCFYFLVRQDQDEENLFIWLARTNDNKNLVLSSLQIDLLHTDGNVAKTICKMENETFFPTQRCLGGNVVATLPRNEIGEDGKISLKCSLEVKSGDDDEEEALPELKWLEDLKKGVYCDFNLKCEDEEIPVSRISLALLSPVFSAMFSENSEEAKNGHVIIEDVDLKSLKALVSFCHGSLDKDDLTTEVLAAANKFKIRVLSQVCEDYLSKTMTVDNSIDYFLAASLNEANKLRTAAKKFITENLVEVEKTEGFKNLEREALVEVFNYLCKNNQ